jgi:hypothetical protein
VSVRLTLPFGKFGIIARVDLGVGVRSVDKLWASFPFDHDRYVSMALARFKRSFPEQTEQFCEDFIAALRASIADKTGEDLVASCFVATCQKAE